MYGFIKGRKTSGIGPRWGGYHRGVDIALPVGTPIHLPPGNWMIEKAGWENINRKNQGYGKRVVARNVDSGKKLIFGHLSRIDTGKGLVAGGTRVGLSGNTGRSTGAHLHLEAHGAAGGVIDPFTLYEGVDSTHNFRLAAKQETDAFTDLTETLEKLEYQIRENHWLLCAALTGLREQRMRSYYVGPGR